MIWALNMGNTARKVWGKHLHQKCNICVGLNVQPKTTYLIFTITIYTNINNTLNNLFSSWHQYKYFIFWLMHSQKKLTSHALWTLPCINWLMHSPKKLVTSRMIIYIPVWYIVFGKIFSQKVLFRFWKISVFFTYFSCVLYVSKNLLFQ